MASVKDLVLNIIADDKTDKAFSGIEGKAKSLNSNLMVGAVAVGGAILAAGGAAVAAGMTMDGAYDTIQQGTGATGDALEGLKESFRNVFSTVPTDAATAGGAIADLNTRTGLTGTGLETLAAQVIRLGTFAGQGAIDINGMTGAFSLFGVPADKMSEQLDKLHAVSQNTGVPVNQLTASLADSGVGMQALGFNITQTASLLGTLDKAGIDSDAVTKAMGKGLLTLAKAGEEPQAAFKRVVTEIGGFIAAGDKAGALDLASKVFGAKGALQMVGALESGAMSLDQIAASSDMAGSSIEALGASTDDFPEKWQTLQNTATIALGNIGEVLIPIITDAFTALKPAMDEFADFTKTTLGPNIKEFFTFIADNKELIGVIIVGIIGLTVAFKAMMIIKDVSAAMAIMNMAFLTSPVTWIILGIVAAVALLAGLVYLIVNNWSSIVSFFGTVWAAIVEGVTVFIGWLTEAFLNFTPLGQIIKNWGAITTWFGEFWGGIQGMVGDAIGWIGGKVEEFIGFFTSIPDRVGAAWTGLIGMIKNVMWHVTSFVVDAWNNTLGGLSFNLPWFFGGGNISFPHLTMPALAAGGIVTGPTVALIGEAGPEAVVPLSKAGQYGFGGGGGSMAVDVPIQLVVDGTVLARAIRRVDVRQAW
jgi:phage-related minor tail protein